MVVLYSIYKKDTKDRSLVKVSNRNLFRINPIYFEICIRASIRANPSLVWCKSVKTDLIRDFESEWIRNNFSILNESDVGIIRIENSV